MGMGRRSWSEGRRHWPRDGVFLDKGFLGRARGANCHPWPSGAIRAQRSAVTGHDGEGAVLGQGAPTLTRGRRSWPRDAITDQGCAVPGQAVPSLTRGRGAPFLARGRNL